MIEYRKQTLTKYLDVLAGHEPVPGGGSAAALTGALGAALLSMVAQYSQGKNVSPAVRREIKKNLRKTETLRKRLLKLVDLDAQAYLQVVKTRQASAPRRKAALQKASEVPWEICRLCYAAVQLAPFLVNNGNRHFVSDVKCACELLLAAFSSALNFCEANATEG